MRAWVHQIGASFDRLSAREQVSALGLGVLVIAMIVGVGGFFVSRDLAKRERRIGEKIATLREIAALQGDYKRRADEQDRLAKEVEKNASLRMLSYLEGLGKKASVEFQTASERQGESTGSDLVKEEVARIDVKNVSLTRLHTFLGEIERGNRLVQVRRLAVKSTYANRELLEASITVGTFKPTKG